MELLRIVFPQHVNPASRLYGGRLMYWICEAGTLTASNHHKGSVVLGAMEDIDILAGVALGDRVAFRSRVQATFGSSMEVRVEVIKTDRAGREPLTTCRAHLTFIALDENGKPTKVAAVDPATDDEHESFRAALDRRSKRLERLSEFDTKDQADTSGFSSPSIAQAMRMVTPDMLLADKVFAGEVMLCVDEIAALACHRYCKMPAVTASLDAVDFHSPILIHEHMRYRAALNHVSKSSMEIGIRVTAFDPYKSKMKRVCTAYATFVAIDEKGKPTPVESFEPITEDEKRRFLEGEARRARRMKRLGR